jgi:cysteine-rich repeat protein
LDGSKDGNQCDLVGGGKGICIGALGGCVVSACGDGFKDVLGGEPCDDGDTSDNGEGGCLSDCSGIQTCGDGVTEGTEFCDDDDAVSNGEGFCVANCTAVQHCGDGMPNGTEQCDDVGDSLLCDDDCTPSACGDGQVNVVASEGCDDGGTEAGDGCTPDCKVQLSWSCTGEPSECVLGGMVMIYAAGQTFTMGSPSSPPEEGRDGDETQHQVTFTQNFSIWSTEVTQEDFKRVMGNWNPSEFACQKCPVEQVSWYDAVAYVNELTIREGGTPCYAFDNVVCEDATAATPSDDYMDCENATQGGIDSATVTLNVVSSIYDCTGFRLPTEAEWEYAARAGTTTATYNGDLDSGHLDCTEPNTVLDPIAWFCGNAGSTHHEKGTKNANAWGLYDMLGNVWEWCHDWYASYPGDVTDPEGPVSGSSRVLRGGSWYNLARYARAADQYHDVPGNRGSDLGLRPARSEL